MSIDKSELERIIDDLETLEKEYRIESNYYKEIGYIRVYSYFKWFAEGIGYALSRLRELL